MIDLHCHVLPGLDDGARDLDDSTAMAAQAAQDGIDVICATPHIRPDHAIEISELAGRVAALQGELHRRGLAVAIASGGEVAQLSALGLSDDELSIVSLGSGRWILLEPAPGPLGADLSRTVEQLTARGFGAVIAHPERHAGQDFDARLRELCDLGALIQWTAEFIADAPEGTPAVRCARTGLVHLLGSDAHSSLAGRPVRLSHGVARLCDLCSAAEVEWIVRRAPEAILRGTALEPYPGAEDDPRTQLLDHRA